MEARLSLSFHVDCKLEKPVHELKYPRMHVHAHTHTARPLQWLNCHFSSTIVRVQMDGFSSASSCGLPVCPRARAIVWSSVILISPWRFPQFMMRDDFSIFPLLVYHLTLQDVPWIMEIMKLCPLRHSPQARDSTHWSYKQVIHALISWQSVYYRSALLAFPSPGALLWILLF